MISSWMLFPRQNVRFGSLADIEAPPTRCPLYPQKQTSFSALAMSALCQKRTHALQQKGLLFDHLVGAREEHRRGSVLAQIAKRK
jgi:hypothetical protein